MWDEMSLKAEFVYNRENDVIVGYENFGSSGRTKLQADHALVFMARGIAFNWKQPLGYFLVAGSVKPAILQTLIRQCLSKLVSVGVSVLALL